MDNPLVGFQQDTRSRAELEREGYQFMEVVTAPFSLGDDLILKVEIYMRGDEMVMKLLETPELLEAMKLLEEEHGTGHR
jgi:hypothetical protein